MSGPIAEGWLTIEEAADEYGVPPSTLRRWAQKGQMKAQKVGKAWLIDEFDLSATMTPVKRRVSLHQLRRKISKLIETYSDSDFPVWIDSVPFLNRSTVVEALKGLLGE